MKENEVKISLNISKDIDGELRIIAAKKLISKSELIRQILEKWYQAWVKQRDMENQIALQKVSGE
jgi:hypothetical protein